MLAYINDNDLRGKAVVDLLTISNYEVTTLQSRIEEVDFSYLGLKGENYLSCDFKLGSRVYTLVYDEVLEKYCKEKQVLYDYLYSDYHLVQGNTYLTTEALIGYMVMDNPISIMQSKVLVIGYGNCGKDIAKKLGAMQAIIHVTNRGTHHRSMVQKHGYQYVPVETLQLDAYDFVINTVPYPMLSKDILKSRKQTCKIYDVASSPYGIKEEDRCDNYYILGGLPAKYAYKSAAKLICKAITKKEEIYVKR
ncbi:MAG: NAD(P)-dependent oxidoreductase [Coprobacillaceae bacterium]